MNQTAPMRPIIENPVSSSATEGAARPKVMRRPAQFSAPAASASPRVVALSSPNLSAEAPAKPTLPAPINWQEDARFAFALLAIVIGVNLLVSAWLSAITRSAPPVSIAAPATESINRAKSAEVVILNEIDPPESGQ